MKFEILCGPYKFCKKTEFDPELPYSFGDTLPAHCSSRQMRDDDDDDDDDDEEERPSRIALTISRTAKIVSFSESALFRGYS